MTKLQSSPPSVDEEHRDKLNYVLIGSFALSVVFSTLYRPTNVREQIDANSVTVDQLDYRSFQQVENAGYSIEVSCDWEHTVGMWIMYFVNVQYNTWSTFYHSTMWTTRLNKLCVVVKTIVEFKIMLVNLLGVFMFVFTRSEVFSWSLLSAGRFVNDNVKPGGFLFFSTLLFIFVTVLKCEIFCSINMFVI